MPVRLLDNAALSLWLMGLVLSVNAQVVVDSSFGSGGALNGPNFQIPDNLGKTVGDNLFHSFTEFSLQSGQSATFTGPDAIQNILGRVTGSKVSEIDGLIKSEITGANLYLLNPKGFLFGENAKLDVDGAFTVSARESIRLGEEGSFNAVNPDQSVFVSAPPEAFGFLGDNPGGGITFQGSRIVTGGGIGLVGGLVELDKARVSSVGESVSGDITVEGSSLTIREGQLRTEATASGNSGAISVTVSGDVLIEDLSDPAETGAGLDRGEFIESIRNKDQTYGNATGILAIGSGTGSGGGIVIDSTDSISINGGGLYSVNKTKTDDSENVAGNVGLNSDSISIENGTLKYDGDDVEGGGIRIEVAGGANISGSSYLSSANGISLSGDNLDFKASLLESKSAVLQIKNSSRVLEKSEFSVDSIIMESGGLGFDDSDFLFQDSANVTIAGDVNLTGQSRIAGENQNASTFDLLADSVSVNEKSVISAGHALNMKIGSEIKLTEGSLLKVRSHGAELEGLGLLPLLNVDSPKVLLNESFIRLEAATKGGNILINANNELRLESGSVIMMGQKNPDYANGEIKLTGGNVYVDGSALLSNRLNIEITGDFHLGLKSSKSVSEIRSSSGGSGAVFVAGKADFIKVRAKNIYSLSPASSNINFIFRFPFVLNTKHDYPTRIELFASEDIKLKHLNFAGGSIPGEGGGVFFKAKNIHFSQSGGLWWRASTSTIKGNSPEIHFSASEELVLSDLETILLYTHYRAPGDTTRLNLHLSGDTVRINNVSMTNWGRYSFPENHDEKYSDNPELVDSYSNMEIFGKSRVEISNGSKLIVETGKLSIASEEIDISNSSLKLMTYLLGDSLKDGGALELTANESVSINNSTINLDSHSKNSRNNLKISSGNLKVVDSSLSMLDGLRGKKGAMDINVNNEIELTNTSITSQGSSIFDATNNGNDINLAANTIKLDDSLIYTSVSGTGLSGVTAIEAREGIEIKDSLIDGRKPVVQIIEDKSGDVRYTVGTTFESKITTDGAIGEEVSIEGTTLTVPFELGQESNGYLFHSFENVNLIGGNQLKFLSGDATESILARFTGDDISVLDGVVELSKKDQNLTLLSGSGFLFGPNTTFKVDGHLSIYSGNEIQFNDGNVFGMQSNIPNLTESSEIVGLTKIDDGGHIRLIGSSINDLGFGDPNLEPKDIIIAGETIELKKSSSISTVGGGDVNLSAVDLLIGDQSSITTKSPYGKIGGNILLNTDNLVSDSSEIGTYAEDGEGGDLVIRADTIKLSLGKMGTTSNPKKISGRAGNIDIDATTSIWMDKISVKSESNSSGGTGHLRVKTKDLTMNGTPLTAPSEFAVMANNGPSSWVEIEADNMILPAFVFRLEAHNNENYLPDTSEIDRYGLFKLKANNIMFGKGYLQIISNNKNIGSRIDIDVTEDIVSDILWIIHGSNIVGKPNSDLSWVKIHSRNFFGNSLPRAEFAVSHSGDFEMRADEQIILPEGVMALNEGAALLAADQMPSLSTSFIAPDITLGLSPDKNPTNANSFQFFYNLSNQSNPSVDIIANEKLVINPGVIINTPLVHLESSDLQILNAQINLPGHANHLIEGRDSLTLAGETKIQLNSFDLKEGEVQERGTLKFLSKNLVVNSGASVVSSTQGGEPSASLIFAADNFKLDGGLIQTVTNGAGRAGDISLQSNSSSIQNAGNLGSQTEGEGAAGDIHVEGGTLDLGGGSSIRSGVDLNAKEMNLDASGDAGAVTVDVESISLSGGSYVASTALDVGQSKDVTVKAGSIKLDGQSYITSTSQATENVGQYGLFEAGEEHELTRNGGVSLTGDAIELAGGSYLKTTTNLPYRQAGDIAIKGESIVLGGGSAVVSNTEPSGQVAVAMEALGMGDQTPNYGNAGTVAIEGQTVTVTGGSRVASDSFTDGDGGNVSIKADTLNLQDRSRIYAGALNEGDGGQISIETGKLNARGQAAIVADVRDSGQGGEVSIDAGEMNLDHASVYGSTSGEGAGSRIQVQANELNLFNGARIESAAFGLGQAGELDIAADTVAISGQGEWFDPKDVDAEPSGQVARSGFVTSTGAGGDAGTIHLTTPNLNLDAGIIGSASTGEGAAGSINLGIGESMLLQNNGQVSVRSALANGGDITIQTGGHVLVDNSELSASAKLDGGSVRLYGDGNFFFRDGRITAEAGQDGGNIFVEAPDTLVLQRSRLSANAIHGHGGYILITADGFLPSIETSITASSEFGVQGTVEIRTPDTEVGSGLVVLPETLVSKNINLAERCALRLAGDVSSFFLNGQGGIPVWASHSYLPTLIIPEPDDAYRPSDRSDEQ